MGFWEDAGNFLSDAYHQINIFDKGATFRTEQEDRAEQEAYKAQGLTPPDRIAPDERRKQLGTSAQYAQLVAQGKARIDPFRQEYNFSGKDFVAEYAKSLRLNKQKDYDLLFATAGEDGKGADFRNLAPSKQNYGEFIDNAQVFKTAEGLGAKRIYTQNLQAIANDEQHPEYENARRTICLLYTSPSPRDS